MKIVNEHQIQGRILHLGGVEWINDNFQKRLVVIEQENPKSSTPWEVPIEFFNNNMSVVSGLAKGDLVIATFQARGKKTIRDGKAKWWGTMEGIMISKSTG